MPAILHIELHPFKTPNFVREVLPSQPRQDGFHESPTHPLSRIDALTLAKMCDDFRAEVFAKAGKDDPAKSNA